MSAGTVLRVRLAGDCPSCGGDLVVRHRNRDHGRFLGCRSYPRCRWTGNYDAALEELDATINRLQADLALALSAPRTDVGRELRDIIAAFHPDRWPHASELATEVTKRLNDLRGRLS